MQEAKRILLEVVIVEDAPRPANDRIRMHVWNVVERELADNLVPHTYHRGQIIVPAGKYGVTIGGGQPGYDLPSTSGEFVVNGETRLPE